ncbi:MAG: hypothetical protein ACK4IY_09300 [Chitinophagales bacterium]
MKITSQQGKLFLGLGAVVFVSLFATKFLSSNSKNTGGNTQAASFYTLATEVSSEPCVADHFRNYLPAEAKYRPIRWSKAVKGGSIHGADSVIVHGYKLINESGQTAVYTKMIYFDTECRIVFME